MGLTIQSSKKCCLGELPAPMSPSPHCALEIGSLVDYTAAESESKGPHYAPGIQCPYPPTQTRQGQNHQKQLWLTRGHLP
jgi:hypothetical protein